MIVNSDALPLNQGERESCTAIMIHIVFMCIKIRALTSVKREWVTSRCPFNAAK